MARDSFEGKSVAVTFQNRAGILYSQCRLAGYGDKRAMK
jgi:hypothetical protein